MATTKVTIASKVRNSYVKDLGVAITSTKTFVCKADKDELLDFHIYMLTTSTSSGTTAYDGTGLKMVFSTGDFGCGTTADKTLYMLTTSSDTITGFHLGPFDSANYAQIAASTTDGFNPGDPYYRFAFTSIIGNSTGYAASTNLTIGALLYVSQANLV